MSKEAESKNQMEKNGIFFVTRNPIITSNYVAFLGDDNTFTETHKHANYTIEVEKM